MIPKNKLNHNSHHKKKIHEYFLIGIFGILIFILVQPAFLKFTERDLPYHMTIEHTLFFVIGVMSIQVAETILKLSNRYRNDHPRLGILISLWARLLRRLFTINKYGYVWIISAIGILTFWHIPSIFDYAELNTSVHIAQHISFILVGAMAFLASRSLGESFTLLALFALNGIMGFVGLTFTLLDRPIYLVYSVNSHNNAGTYMLISCIVLLLVVLPVYLIRRALFHINVRRSGSSTLHSNFSTAENNELSRQYSQYGFSSFYNSKYLIRLQ